MTKFTEVKEIVDAATPAPWVADTGERGDCVVWGPNGRFLMNMQAEPHWVPDPSGKTRAVSFDVDYRDANFVAAARHYMPRMLDAMSEVEDFLDNFIEGMRYHILDDDAPQVKTAKLIRNRVMGELTDAFSVPMPQTTDTENPTQGDYRTGVVDTTPEVS